MGTKIQTPPTGVNCINWDPPGETPEFLYVYFWEVKKGDIPIALEPPNNHIFKLTQNPAQPCIWTFLDLAWGWYIQVGLAALTSWLWLAETGGAGRWVFADSVGPSPIVPLGSYTNWYQDPVGNWGYEGYGTIFLMQTIGMIADDFGLSDMDQLKLEMFGVGEPVRTAKYCSRRDRTNVKIQFEP